VTAQVGRVATVALDQRLGDGVPVAGVVAAAVDQYERWLALVAPDDVVELEALGAVEAGLRFDGRPPNEKQVAT